MKKKSVLVWNLKRTKIGKYFYEWFNNGIRGRKYSENINNNNNNKVYISLKLGITFVMRNNVKEEKCTFYKIVMI